MTQEACLEPTTEATRSPELARPLVWHLPTRLFHWALVVMIAFQWISYTYAEAMGDSLLKWHRWNGIAVLVLIVWRVLWGIAGPDRARFVMFVRGPGRSIRYANDMIAGRASLYLGHNPLGAWMVVALLAAVAAQAGMGLFTVEHNDLTAGPLYRLVSEPTQKMLSRWHASAFYYVVLVLVAIHVLANLYHVLVKKEPLVQAMISGRKPAGDYEDALAARQMTRPNLVAALLLIAACAIVLGGIKLAGGRFI